MKPATVAVAFAEALAAIESAWSLVAAGHRVVAFTRRGARPPLRLDPDVEVHEVTPPEQDALACVADLQRLVDTLPVDVVMPLDDAALWVLARVRSPARAGPAGEHAALALDKRRQLGAAARAGFAVADTWSGPAEDAGPVAAEILPWPVVVRPALAADEVGGRLVRRTGGVAANAAELPRVLARIPSAEPVLVQPWIDGTGEGVVGLAGAPSGPHAHRRVRMVNPRGSGSSACAAAELRAEEAAATQRLLAEARWSGLFMVELLRDRGGVVWFVELNGRAWGSMALSRRRGLEYPAWAVAQALGRPLPAAPASARATRVQARHLARDLLHLAAVLRDPHPPRPLPRPGRRRTLRAVLDPRGGALYNHRRDRRRLLVADTLRTLRP